MMTGAEQRAFLFIKSRLAETGVAPSFEQIKEHLGLKSKSGVHRVIVSLESKGAIVRLKHRSRAIAVVGERDETGKISDGHMKEIMLAILKEATKTHSRKLTKKATLEAIAKLARGAL